MVSVVYSIIVTVTPVGDGRWVMVNVVNSIIIVTVTAMGDGRWEMVSVLCSTVILTVAPVC